MTSSVLIRALLFSLLLCGLAGTVSATSYIQLFVHPGSGTVCVDNTCNVNVGTLAGYSSSQFQDLTCGMDHTVRVYNTAGYQDYTETVYMDYNCDSVTDRIYLEPVPTESPAPETGDIQVYVSPGLGQVCRDNVECEVSTGEPADTWSVQFSDVSSDESHTITATADGYQPATVQVSVTPGTISTVNLQLVPLTTGTSAGATASPAGSAPATTASPLSGEVVLLAAGIAGALAVSGKRW